MIARLAPALCLLALAGCGGDPSLAASLADAAKPAHLPGVVSCWEKEFESSQSKGDVLVTVHFTIEGGTSKIRDATIETLEQVKPEDGVEPAKRDLGPFKACVQKALDASQLPLEADKDGPGFSTQGSLSVRNFRIAFTDASSKRREAASARQANVLIGPRADRCQGLYSHDPPRDASTLYTEIDTARTRAKALGADRDQYARELQKEYDALLELTGRLAADLAEAGIPEANKARIKKALEETKEAAKKAGARIGCAR